ncbi:hypothetical protein MTR67_033134 [Solanum verrucosum]|uniref:Uncharacterized protein n=1 Tax=Solanum verrucosum TaxID=315347 RepID=A0AAF0U5Y0_SOLVR|nr:hypothetical protein MTR67_033134 [Solanum verrucosum]
MMKRNKREEIREEREKLGLKWGRKSLVGGSASTSTTLKRLHALKRREIMFGSTSTNGV